MQEHGFDAFLMWGHGAGALLYLIALWSLISYGISWIGGWHRLAEQYRCGRAFDGERWRFRSGLMRWSTSYRSILTLGADRDGLYLGVLFLFRLGHPPLFIPWSEITVSERRRWLMAGTQFVLGREAQIPLWVFRRVGERILSQRPSPSADDVMKEFYSRPGLDSPRAIQ